MAKKKDDKKPSPAKEKVEHLHLPECKSCWALREDFYDGILADRAHNPQRVYLARPLEYMRTIEDDLQNKQRIKGAKPYKVSIKVNTKDNRVFESAEFRYGKRLLRYSTEQKTSLPRVKTTEPTVFCVKETNITRRINVITELSARKYAQQMKTEWEKQGFKGTCVIRTIGKKEIVQADYVKAISIGKNKEGRDVESGSDFHLTSQVNEDGKLQIKVIQNITTSESLSLKINPTEWARQTHSQLKDNNFDGYIETNINSYGKTVIVGKYTKQEYSKTGSTYTEVVFYNSDRKLPDQPKETKTDTSNYRPTKKVGKDIAQVRSIAQDDEYTPIERRRRNAENGKIQRESELYNEQKRLADEARMLRQQAKAIKQQVAKKIDSAGHSINYTRELELNEQATQLERRADAIEQILKK